MGEDTVRIASTPRTTGLAVVLGAALLSGCAASPSSHDLSEGAGPVPAPRTPALAACPVAGTHSSLPSLTLRCLGQGPKVDPSSLGGRPVLVNLWASWCGPCRQEMPSLQAAYDRYGSRVAFLGVDTKDSTDSAKDFLATVAVHYPQVVDDNGDLLHGVGGSGLPVTIVLNAAGKTLYSHRGEMHAKDLRAALSAAGIDRPRL